MVRPLNCGSGLVWSGLLLDQRRSVVSCKTSSGYDTLVFDDGRLVETWPNLLILAASADRQSWLVQRTDPPGSRKIEPRTSPELDENLRTHVEIWDSKTLTPRGRLKDLVSMAAFSADGRVLVTSDVKNVDIRDGRTGDVLHTIRHYESDRVVAVAISPDGRRLLTMGRPVEPKGDGVVLWDLSFE